MLAHHLRRTGGWAAVAAGVLGILTTVSLLLFFTFEIEQAIPDAEQGIDRIHLFGFISDTLPIFAGPAALVIVALLRQAQRQSAPRLSAIAALLGMAGNLLMAVNSMLFVTEQITLTQQTYLFYIAMAPLGLWHVLVNTLAWRSALLPARLTKAGIVVGVGQILIFVVLFCLGAYDAAASSNSAEIMTNVPLLIGLAISVVGILLGYIGAPIWLVWLGCVLIRQADQRGAAYPQTDAQASFHG